MEEQLELRVHGAAGLPALVYLPGLHGDWTIIGGFRQALGGRVRFVEMNYPRTLTWSLDDYAAAVENALAEQGITGAWLLGESYGSQVLWAMVRRGRYSAPGVILAGGFVRHPMRWAVRLLEWCTGRLSNRLIVWAIFLFAKVTRWRFRNSPAVLAHLDEFISRRTELDLRAAQHRLHLIAGSDPRNAAAAAQLPVYGLTGVLDPIVPWPWVRGWLKSHCSSLREYKVITGADHNVLGTAPGEASRQILLWMGVK